MFPTLVRAFLANISTKESHALAGFYFREPNEGQSARIQNAVFRSHLDARKVPILQPEEHCQLFPALQLYRSRTLLVARVVPVIAIRFQLASSATLRARVAVVAAANRALALGCFHRVTNPRRTSRVFLHLRDRGCKPSCHTALLNPGILDAGQIASLCLTSRCLALFSETR